MKQSLLIFLCLLFSNVVNAKGYLLLSDAALSSRAGEIEDVFLEELRKTDKTAVIIKPADVLTIQHSIPPQPADKGDMMLNTMVSLKDSGDYKGANKLYNDTLDAVKSGTMLLDEVHFLKLLSIGLLTAVNMENVELIKKAALVMYNANPDFIPDGGSYSPENIKVILSIKPAKGVSVIDSNSDMLLMINGIITSKGAAKVFSAAEQEIKVIGTTGSPILITVKDAVILEPVVYIPGNCLKSAKINTNHIVLSCSEREIAALSSIIDFGIISTTNDASGNINLAMYQKGKVIAQTSGLVGNGLKETVAEMFGAWFGKIPESVAKKKRLEKWKWIIPTVIGSLALIGGGITTYYLLRPGTTVSQVHVNP